ncbi:MAG: hypothetical protein STHCBS139747_006625 [Sporothrix thermara]
MADRHPIYSRHQMASRVGAGAFPRTARVAANSSSNNSGASTASASTSVRRNLFQSQLTRRPTHAMPTGSASVAPSLDGSERDIGAHLKPGPAEIVVRDRNGEVELVDPPSPTADEMGETALDARQEVERERQRLADTIKYHQQRTSIPGQPEVSALAEDNWMYEPEDMPRIE